MGVAALGIGGGSISSHEKVGMSKKRKLSMEYPGTGTGGVAALGIGGGSIWLHEKAGKPKKRKLSMEYAGTGTTITSGARFSPFGESSSHSSQFWSSASSTHHLETTGTGGGGGYSLVTHNKDKVGTSKKNERKAPNPTSVVDLTDTQRSRKRKIDIKVKIEHIGICHFNVCACSASPTGNSKSNINNYIGLTKKNKTFGLFVFFW